MSQTQMSDDLGVISEFSTTCGRIARTAGVPLEVLQRINDSKTDSFWTDFRNNLKRAAEIDPSITVVSTAAAISDVDDWKIFYKKFFDIDLAAVRVPDGLDRTLYFPEGISINAVVKAHIDRNIPFWKYCSDDLESVMRESERGPVKASYAIRVRKGQEADNDLRNLSAEDITERGIDTENLLERLIHGLKYYDETGKHLDVKNVTLCAGSRYADGSVPRVDRDVAGWVFVRWGLPQDRNSGLRARRVVR